MYLRLQTTCHLCICLWGYGDYPGAWCGCPLALFMLAFAISVWMNGWMLSCVVKCRKWSVRLGKCYRNAVYLLSALTTDKCNRTWMGWLYIQDETIFIEAAVDEYYASSGFYGVSICVLCCFTTMNKLVVVTCLNIMLWVPTMCSMFSVSAVSQGML